MNRRGPENPERRELGDELNELTYAVIGAAMEVHKELGPGFLEVVYENSLREELHRRGIPFQPQPKVNVIYKGVLVGKGRYDMLVANTLLVELKSVQTLAPIHEAQVISYLKMTGHPLALLINFNVRFLKEGIRRLILS
ncbi:MULTISPECIES: GxxExxY protein [unclassified Microcoleus]|uniref:GxxExxY protein n=1 Tax=unclassified Microcoleus TaxID=2642155 RepID=UPI002FD0EFB2